MKLYRNIIFFFIAILWAGIFVGCNEDNTLDGATEVYITLNPTDITLRVGDTVNISAVITNVSGKVIETPIAWSVLDDDVAKILGDTAVVCVPGAQGKQTKLKATLTNGKYGLSPIIVTTNLPKGITLVNDGGAIIESKHSYNIAHDSAIFAVSPKEVLEDFEPEYTIEGLEPFKTPMTVDKRKGLVTVHYSAPRKTIEGKITVTIGEGNTAPSATCPVIVAPTIKATFYGEQFATMPEIGTRPGKDVLSMYFAYSSETKMDISTETTVRVAMNLESGAEADIKAAYDAYRWEVVTGGPVVVTRMSEEYVEDQGFDAVLTVRAGIEEGEAEFHCITPDTVLVATFKVQDYTNRYPVNEITVSHEFIKMPVNGSTIITTGVEPSSSYAYHKPAVTAENPAIIEVGEYDGNMITLRGLEVGTTKLILTSNGKRLEIPVEITEAIKQVLWKEGNNRTLFAGQSVQWGIEATTISGASNPYDANWISSDTKVLTATQVEGDNSKGIITAIAEGTAVVLAKITNVSTNSATVKVIGLPSDVTYTPSNTNGGDTSVSPDDDNENDLMVVVVPTSGIYKMIKIKLIGAYSGADNYDGTYSVGKYPVNINIDEAEITADLGQVTIASDANGNAVISFELTASVGDKSFTLKANNVLGIQ